MIEPMETTTAQPRRLSRHPHDRFIGGVAGGLGRYFDLDPVLFRIAFVGLALFGGSGVALYVAGWLLVPEDGDERSIAAHALAGHGRHRGRLLRMLVVVFAAVALFDLVFFHPWWAGRPWAAGSGLATVAIVIALALAITSRRRLGRVSPARVIGVSLAIMVAGVLIALSALVAMTASSGVPLRGGIGDRYWRPVSAGEVRPAYHLALGDLTVDLSDARLRAGRTKVVATVGTGHLLVRVPSGVAVSVAAHSGLGAASVFGDRDEGVGAERSVEADAAPRSTDRRLVVDATVGTGEVEVVRTGPS